MKSARWPHLPYMRTVVINEYYYSLLKYGEYAIGLGEYHNYICLFKFSTDYLMWVPVPHDQQIVTLGLDGVECE